MHITFILCEKKSFPKIESAFYVRFVKNAYFRDYKMQNFTFLNYSGGKCSFELWKSNANISILIVKRSIRKKKKFVYCYQWWNFKLLHPKLFPNAMLFFLYYTAAIIVIIRCYSVHLQ